MKARLLVLLAILTLILSTFPIEVQAAGSGLSSVPRVDVNEADLSTQLLTKIFGQGWANLAGGEGPGGDGPTLVFTLLKTLNSLCAIAVAWMVIFTTLVGAIGAAHEGKALAGRHSSPWVPIRFAFSFSAIAPVFSGLNAMQIIILAGIGMSINMANTMWDEGLKYIDKFGAVIADTDAPGIKKNSRTLAGGVFEILGMVQYLQSIGGCNLEGEGATVGGKWVERSGTDAAGNPSAGRWVLLLDVPAECSRGITNLQLGDLGSVSFPKTDLGSDKVNAEMLDRAKVNAINQLFADMNDPATKLGTKVYSHKDLPKIYAAADNYARNLTAALHNAAAHSAKRDGEPNKLNLNVSETAGGQGWFMAGSYYWLLVEAHDRAVKALTVEATYSPPNVSALMATKLVYSDWVTYAQPNVDEVKNTLEYSSLYDFTTREAIESEGTWSKVRNAFNFIPQLLPRFVAGMSENSPDALLTYSQTARKIITGIELAVVGYITVTAASKGASSSLWGWFADKATGAPTAISEGLSMGFWLLMICVIPLYLVFWVFAYIVPAIPFLTWIACIVGWLVLSVEAVIAAPIWLVGHCMPEGEGFAGASGRNGYALFLSVLLRPMLLVLSMFVCLCLMCSTGMLISALFKPYVDTTGLVMGNFTLASSVALMIILGSTITILTWKMFELTTAMPDRIIRWVGQLLANLGDEARGMAEQSVNTMRAGGDSMSKSAGGKLKSMPGAIKGRAEAAEKKKAAADNAEKQHQMKNVGERKNTSTEEVG